MFAPHPERPRVLLVGAGAGIESIVELAHRLGEAAPADWKPLVLLDAQAPLPFRPRPSTILVPGIPAGTIACMPLLDEIGIASRLASAAGHPGCYEGDVAELAATWMATLDGHALAEVEMFASGTPGMLDATSAVARRFGVPLQLRAA